MPRERPQRRDALRTTGIKGIVLAGVHSWGNCVLEQVAPRALLPVADRPLVVHVLTWLREAGVSSASICANSDTAALRRALGNGEVWGTALDYYEDVMPRGPAGCVRDAAGQSDWDTYIVADAAIIPRLALGDALREHEATGAALTVIASESSSCSNHHGGLLEPTGIYIFSRRVLGYIPATGYQDIKEALIPRLHAHGEAVVTHAIPRNQIARITGIPSYLAVNKWAVARLAAQPVFVPDYMPSRSSLPWTPGSTSGDGNAPYIRRGEAWIHRSAEVAGTARLVGPVLIGPGCRLGSGVLIAGPTALGEGCQIDEQAVISRSFLWRGCHVGARSVVDHSVLTDHAYLARGRRATEDVVVSEGWSLRRRLWGGRHGRPDGRVANVVSPTRDETRSLSIPLAVKACPLAPAVAGNYAPVMSPRSDSAGRWAHSPVESK